MFRVLGAILGEFTVEMSSHRPELSLVEILEPQLIRLTVEADLSRLTTEADFIKLTIEADFIKLTIEAD